MPTATINLPFTIERGADGFSYCPERNISGSCYAGSMEQAKTKLRPMIEKQVDEALLLLSHQRKYLIGCVDGTVLLVCHTGAGLICHITGGNRQHACSTMANWKTFEEAENAARSLAEQSYCGIAWQMAC